MAASSSLAALLEQSRSMANNLGASRDIPYVELGIDQVESASRRLGNHAGLGGLAGPSNGVGSSSRMVIDGVDEGAAYLAAHGNVNYPFISRTLNSLDPAAAFAPLQPLQDTDLEGHLRHAHEQTIISAIEEGRRSTIRDFYANMEKKMQRDWEAQKELIFEEIGRHASTSGTSGSSLARSSSNRRLANDVRMQEDTSSSLSGSTQMRPRQVKYALAVRRINDGRRQGLSTAAIDLLSEASVAGHMSTDPRSSQLVDTWRLLAQIADERDAANGEFKAAALEERQYAQAYLAGSEDTSSARDLQVCIARGAVSFLEEQFLAHVEKRLQAKPAEANLGGIPSIQNKIRAYINIQYQKNGQWPQNLEIVDGQPLWARLFLLLRAGHPEEAQNFVAENMKAIEKLERGFVRYFRSWSSSQDGRLPRAEREAFVKDYLRRIKYQPDNNGDPFKFALYKLIGRMEPERRSVPGVTNTTEDWLWLQLRMVRELAEPGDAVNTSLRGLAKVLIKFGEKHFDPKGQRPLLYFQVLLMAGQFERAVAFLHNTSQYQIDAVHFAVALSYYGLLRVPSQADASDIDIFTSKGPEGPHYLNLGRILYRYYRQFSNSDPTEALQYIYVLTLNADLPKPVGEEQVQRCQACVRELVMESRAYAELLGDVRSDGTKVAGRVEQDLKLLHLRNEKEYLQNIVKAAAQRADQEKRFADTILLYNLAEEYNSVVQVLNAALGASLSKPGATAAESAQAQASKSFGMVDDVASSARSILEHYDRSAMILHRISRKSRETCRMLLQVRDAFTLQEQNRLQEALDKIEELHLIPLRSDLTLIVRGAEDIKQLDEAVLRNLDTILLNTMNILYKMHTALKESPYGDASRQETMNQLRMKARALMMFAGMLKYRLSGETYAQLTRLDVYLH